MNKLHPIDNFIQDNKLGRVMTPDEFAIFCKEGVKLAFKYPSKKDKIAYEIVEKGWNMGCFDDSIPNPLIQKIWDLAAILELLDHHVYVDDGVSVKEKWLILKDLVDELESQKDN